MPDDLPLHARPLAEGDLGPDPVEAFGSWFREAAESGARLPEAMALATATSGGVPSARMVLLKEYGERGFVFFTGYESRKGSDLAGNPRASLLFYWDLLGRQVRIDGTVERVSREQSEQYFATRPLASRLSALASRQSQVIASRQELEARVERLQARYADGNPPLPDDWGGYRLTPSEYEFWQHRDDRLHDRVRYRPDGAGGWRIERLQP